MCQTATLTTTAWRDSNTFKKLQNTVFIPYMRDGDNIEYYDAIHFKETNPMMVQLEEDYKEIQVNAAAGVMTGGIGTYLQTRTKGAGHGSTSRAFYLRPSFLVRIMRLQELKNLQRKLSDAE
jgi:hypothetical protein